MHADVQSREVSELEAPGSPEGCNVAENIPGLVARLFLVFNPHPRIRLLILQGGGTEGGGRKERDRERHRSIGWLPRRTDLGIRHTSFWCAGGTSWPGMAASLSSPEHLL